MQSTKAENEPKNAIIELNSGTTMEVATIMSVSRIRCNMANIFLVLHDEVPVAVTESSFGFTVSSAGVTSGSLIPSKIEIVVLS